MQQYQASYDASIADSITSQLYHKPTLPLVLYPMLIECVCLSVAGIIISLPYSLEYHKGIHQVYDYCLIDNILA